MLHEKIIQCKNHPDPCFVLDAKNLTVIPISTIFTVKRQLPDGQNVSIFDTKHHSTTTPIGIKPMWAEDLLTISKDDIISIFPDDTKLTHKGSINGYVISDDGDPYLDAIRSLSMAGAIMITAGMGGSMSSSQKKNIDETLKELLF